MHARNLALATLALAAAPALAPAPARAEVIGEVTTEWKLIGANHRIVVESFNDPAVAGVTCHLSRAVTGGVKGSLGIAEDTSDASIACRQTGPIAVDLAELRKQDGKRVFTERTSFLFKTMQVVRMTDVPNRTIVYLVYSDKLIDGSPKNAISSVPVMPWR